MSYILPVDAGTHSYVVRLGDSIVSIDESLRVVRTNCSSAVIVTNDTVGPLYAARLEAALTAAGLARVLVCELPDGEAYKTHATLDRIYGFLLQHHCDRECILFALGGGVIGDITGFAAATYMRGIRYVQVPTTLLAMVDSSVGGKTAVNHPLGKNMIGAFHQPLEVCADVSTLATLPGRELTAGIAEIIKHACIRDAHYFAWLEDHIHEMLDRDPQVIMQAIKRSIEIKAEVVAQDEREQGLRAILNFGHTFGHAIEAGLGFGVCLHGEAVAAGMVAAATLSQQLGLLSAEQSQAIESLIARAGLPTRLPLLASTRDESIKLYLDLMQHDKKSSGGSVRYVVLGGLGSARLSKVDDERVSQVIAAMLTPHAAVNFA
jgi:3-dehydroquinate synthase